MVGLLVHGDNHFVTRGPLPNRETALALARHSSLIQIGGRTPSSLAQWSISNKEFRENLEWAVIVPGENEASPAVMHLLAELAAKGIVIHDCRFDTW